MALTIVNEQYPPRKPKLTLTADSLDELPTEGVAEGSTATVGGTEYVYENNSGWIEPGSGGGGSGGGVFLVNLVIGETEEHFDKTWIEIYNAFSSGKSVVFLKDNSSEGWTQYGVYSLNSAYCEGRDGEVVYSVSAVGQNYQTNTENGYPSYSYE